MKKTLLSLCAVIVCLSACGGPPASNEGNSTMTKAMPLDPNPPFGADDIDATVQETRSRMARQRPAPGPGQTAPVESAKQGAGVNLSSEDGAK